MLKQYLFHHNLLKKINPTLTFAIFLILKISVPAFPVEDLAKHSCLMLNNSVFPSRKKKSLISFLCFFFPWLISPTYVQGSCLPRDVPTQTAINELTKIKTSLNLLKSNICSRGVFISVFYSEWQQLNRTAAGNRQLSITSSWKTKLLPALVELDYLSPLGRLSARACALGKEMRAHRAVLGSLLQGALVRQLCSKTSFGSWTQMKEKDTPGLFPPPLSLSLSPCREPRALTPTEAAFQHRVLH